MILTGNEDLRVIKTIEGIKSAFEELICQKDFEKITVKELSEKARINKKTFYHYYADLYDLLAEMQVELSSGFLERVQHYRLPDDLSEVTREFFLYSSEQGEAYEKITCSGSYEYVRNKMIGQVNDVTWGKSSVYQKLSDFDKKLIVNYANTVSLEIYKQWIASGKVIALNEIINRAIILTSSEIQGFFEK